MVQGHTSRELRLDTVFHALSDATRRAMLRRLAAGERKIGDLAEPFDMSFNAVSKHVKVLEDAGLILRRIDGRAHVCSLAPQPLKAADDWLRFYESFWSQSFDALDQLFRAQNEAARNSGIKGKRK
ncbi:MAG TPA: metalloregulator ArsR/SmtB family transcription factor [Hyphomonadaceae bacterium]|jgi:DNA-binding transcriptional ArsR family regulator|nr:metalloregulator ArsR/SmtB family transcription factor [Hyphomonadaceae bacterium]